MGEIWEILRCKCFQDFWKDSTPFRESNPKMIGNGKVPTIEQLMVKRNSF